LPFELFAELFIDLGQRRLAGFLVEPILLAQREKRIFKLLGLRERTHGNLRVVGLEL
jgi:hypothetical protein